MAKKFNYFGSLKKMMLYRSSERGGRGDCVMLRPLTEKQEQEIDDNDYFSLTYNGDDITIPKANILFYGEIDLKNEDDLAIIIKRHLVDENLKYSQIPHNFDYATGVGENSWAPTNNPVDWFKFVHTRLGKPRRVIAYKIKETLA